MSSFDPGPAWREVAPTSVVHGDWIRATINGDTRVWVVREEYALGFQDGVVATLREVISEQGERAVFHNIAKRFGATL